MKISRIVAAGALAFTLALAGCSNGDVEETPEPTTTEATQPTSAPETPDTGGSGTEADDNGDSLQAPQIDSSIDPDAHPFCAVLAKYDDGEEIPEVPSEADLQRLRDMRDEAVAAAPAEIKGDVEIYFGVMVEMGEEAVNTGKAPEIQIDELSEDFQKAFGAILTFSFETCFDLGLDLQTE